MGGLRKGCDLDFYNCIFRTEYGCEYFKGKDSQCAYGIATHILPKRHIKLLKEDAKSNGYSVLPIELHMVYANKTDWLIEFEDGCTQSLVLETNQNVIAPFNTADFPKKISSIPPSLRGSEFNKKYDCQRIWSKVDKRRFDLKDTKLVKIGRAAHTLTNQQHLPYTIENSILEEIGIQPLPRNHYCEVGLLYETEADKKPVCISGHADAILHILPRKNLKNKNSGDTTIFDLKRKAYSTYEEWGFKWQELIYALAAQQQYDVRSKWIYLITAKRPRKPAYNAYRALKYHITKIKNDNSSATLQGLAQEISRTYKAQRTLLENLDEFEKHENVMSKNGVCEKCFDADVCSLVLKKAQAIRMPIGELLEDELKAVISEMIMPG